MISAEQLREARSKLSKIEPVTLPPELGDHPATVRSLTASEMSVAHALSGGADKLDPQRFAATVVFLSLRDAEGNRLFPDDALDEFVLLPSYVIAPLIPKAMSVNGMGVEAGNS
jgi:hypothetical protein